MRGNEQAVPWRLRLAVTLSLLVLVPACSTSASSTSDGSGQKADAVPECVAYEAALSACLSTLGSAGRRGPIASVLRAPTDAVDAERLRAQCAAGSAQLAKACN